MSEQAAVRTESLGKRYGTTWALKDCTLEIPGGSVTALVGPNGAGKTTLLHMVIGLAKQTTGTVEVLGLSPREEAKALLPRLGFVAQDHPALPELDNRRDAQAWPPAQSELGRPFALARTSGSG